ncbi:MAG TPA: O-antigen ligase family protein, partial [Thermoanaerobaculia bacterium]
DALIWGGSLMLLFFVAAYALRRVPLPYILAAVFLPAIANAALLGLQTLDIWNPWVFPEDTYFRATKIAFLGNPDDLGVYLAVPALFAAALALTSARWRVAYGALWLYLTVALLATETITAIGAYTVALAALTVLWKPRAGLLAAGAIPVLVAVLAIFGPTRDRVIGIARSIQNGNWGIAVSGRLVPFAAAAKMCADRPLVGVGPGGYKFHYMNYYIRTREEMPRYFRTAHTEAVNFGEAHNDHLQLLAEMGVPGYVTVAGAILSVGWFSRRRRAAFRDRERNEVAAVLAAPLVILLGITALAQFPLLIAAPAYTYTLLGAVCVAWSGDDDA